MSKEQYNSFDDWFREAAAQPGPPVHDAAWEAMEARLDDQKKRRRGIIFWWFFGGLFLAGGLVMLERMSNGSTDPKRNPAMAQTSTKVQGRTAGSPIVTEKEAVTAKPMGQEKVQGPEPEQSKAYITKEDNTGISTNQDKEVLKAAGTRPGIKVRTSEGPTAGNGSKSRATKKSAIENSPVVSGVTKNGNPGKKSKKGALESQPVAPVNEINTEALEQQAVTAEHKKLTTDSTIQQTAKIDSTVKDQPELATTKKPAKTPEKKTHFYVFGSAAPEWSYVKKRGAGDMAISYGGGIGYMFSRKWAVQVALFKAAKKYSAGPGDYTPKPGSYYDNPAYVIESVDADCDILEIPLTVRYTFLQRKKTQYFAMAGIASVIMKKETYDYDYLRYGNPRYSSYTYTTGAFHLFSTASFSVGLEQKLNRNLSVLIAPYINIPLQGIGEGKIYLNSFGVQGGLKYNLPF